MNEGKKDKNHFHLFVNSGTEVQHLSGPCTLEGTQRAALAYLQPEDSVMEMSTSMQGRLITFGARANRQFSSVYAIRADALFNLYSYSDQNAAYAKKLAALVEGRAGR